MDKISVIVPVYNVEKYISRCIQSILLQSYSNYELIVVNDGSTDASGDICDSFAMKDKRIKVIHQNNLGVSRARNRGLCEASGSYITFIDGDDWVDVKYLEILLGAVQNNADIAICGGVEINDHNAVLRQYSFSEFQKLEYNNSKLYEPPYFTYVIHRTMFSSRILTDLIFDEKITNGEDSLFLCETFIRAKRGIAFLTYTGYFYFIRENSLAHHNGYNYNKFTSVIATEKRLSLLKKNKIIVSSNVYRSFLLETYRLYSYILHHPEWYRNEDAEFLMTILRKYNHYSSILSDNVLFQIKFYFMVHNRQMMEKELRKRELPLPYVLK